MELIEFASNIELPQIDLELFKFMQAKKRICPFSTLGTPVLYGEEYAYLIAFKWNGSKYPLCKMGFYTARERILCPDRIVQIKQQETDAGYIMYLTKFRGRRHRENGGLMYLKVEIVDGLLSYVWRSPLLTIEHRPNRV